MSEETVKLGLMPPLSGLVGIYGTEILRAGQIACQEINENGGVLGRPLELIIEDDGSLPDSAVIAAEKLVAQHQCVAIIGNLLSNSRISVAYRVAEPRKVPLLNFSFYEGSILSRYFFNFAALPNQQIDKMIPYMKNHFGPRMFFAGNNYEWPRGSIHAGKRILESIGGEVVGEEYCPIGVDNETIKRLLDHVEQASPDVFVPYFAGIDQVNLLTRFTERGLKNKMKVVMGHYDEMMASQLSAEVREGFYSSNTYFMTVDTDPNRDFLKRLANYPGISGVWPKGNGILTNFGEGTYACVKAFAKAANAAGSVEPEALVESLKNISIASPQGIVEMNPEHHHAKVNAYLSRCRTDGEFEIIKQFGVIDPTIPERYNHQRIIQHATMEEDIRLQARMLEQMFEAIFLISSQEGSILYSNAGANSMYGYAKGEMEGLSISQLNDPALCEPHKAATDFINILNQKGEWKGEVRNITKDGSPIWCSAVASTFTHPVFGEVWLLVNRDITNRKLAEDALAASEEKLRLIHSRVPGIVYQFKVDTNGNRSLPYVSPTVANYLGVTSESVMNDAEKWFDLTHPDDLPGLEASIVESMTNMTTWDWIGRFIRDDSDVRWLHGTSTPEKFQDGSTLWNGVFIDITEQKQAETELEKYRNHLEELVDERTTDLKEARDEAEKANAIKSEFLSRMSHELRTPMNAILGFGQLLEMDAAGFTETQQQNIKEILDAGQHLLTLINEVLDLAKIESGNLVISMDDVNVIEVLKGSIVLVQHLADERHLEIVNNVSNDSCIVQADPLRLKQVLLNLLSNAVKYNCEAGRITLNTNVMENQRLRISVTDTGNGLNETEVAKLFNSFERLESVDNVEGTGIGLVITKHLIELMGGSIGVDSSKGKGCTFWVELPLEADKRNNTHKVPKQNTSILETAARFDIKNSARKYTVLYIEDNPANLQLVSQLIISHRKNINLLTASEPLLGIDLIEEHKPDLILLDINLPGMDGYEVLEKLKKNPAMSNIPVIAISANAMKKDIKRGMTAGFDDYITKPVNMNLLLDAIDIAIKRAQ